MMSANRAFALLMWIGLVGIGLFVAGAVRLALGAWPVRGDSHQLIDGVCVIAPVHGDIASHALSYGAAALMLVAAGIALRYFGRQSIGFKRLRFDMARAGSPESDERLQRIISGAGITARVFLVSKSQRIAFTAGLWNPTIYVTTGLCEALNDRQLEAVLLHEEFHCRRRDPLRAVTARALSTLLFFLPVLRDLAAYHHIVKELEADAVAIRRQGTRSHLASALYKLGNSKERTPAHAVGFNEPASAAARIQALCEGHWHGSAFASSTALWSATGVFLLVALVTQPVPITSDWWTVAFSSVACPAWLLVYWLSSRK